MYLDWYWSTIYIWLVTLNMVISNVIIAIEYNPPLFSHYWLSKWSEVLSWCDWQFRKLNNENYVEYKLELI